MQRRLSRIICLCISIAVVFAFMPVDTYAYASLEKGSSGYYYFDLDESDEYSFKCKVGKTYSLSDYSGYDIDYAESSDETVLQVENGYGNSFDIHTVGKGHAEIWIYDEDDFNIGTIYVTVTTNRTAKVKGKIYRNTQKVKVQVTDARKGDTVKLKIGKKTYTKKIKKKASKKTLTFKIRKPKNYGKKYKLTLVHGKKTVYTTRGYIYFAKNPKKGYTKKQMKWVPWWGDPDKKTTTSKTETWYYDWDEYDGLDSYLYFYKGKVRDWLDAS